MVMVTMVLRIFSVQWGESMMTFQGRVHVLSSLHVSPSWQSKNSPCHLLFHPYIKNNKKSWLVNSQSILFNFLDCLYRAAQTWSIGNLVHSGDFFYKQFHFFTNNSSQLSDFLFIILANNYFVFCQTFGALVTISAATHCFQVSPVIFLFLAPSSDLFVHLPKTFSTLSMATFRKGVRE